MAGKLEKEEALVVESSIPESDRYFLNIAARNTLLVGLWIVIIASCGCTASSTVSSFRKASQVDRVMDSWIGHYESELIDRWGSATRVRPDGRGGRILIYESLKGIWAEEQGEALAGGGQYPQPREPGYVANRTFYVNSQGLIYLWKWSGL